MKKNSGSIVTALARVTTLRNKERTFRTEAEQKIRAAIELEGAGLHQQVAEAVYDARDRGASWADIKRAYGSQDYRTLSALYDEAVANGALTTDSQNRDSFVFTHEGDLFTVTGYTWEGVEHTGNEPLVLLKRAPGDYAMETFPQWGLHVYQYNSDGEPAIYKAMAEVFDAES